MNIQSFAKKDIALHQIETALSLFSQQGDLFSVITLAGAAEEILGQLLQQKSGAQWGSMGVASILEILRPTSRKGARRGGPSVHEADSLVHLDPHHEALFLLGRAVDDYIALSGTPSPAMLKFKTGLPAQ